ncbi:MAG: AMP-binding protein, partial [Chloroflexota bacterium]
MQKSKVELSQTDNEALLSQLEQQQHLINELIKSHKALTEKVQSLLLEQVAPNSPIAQKNGASSSAKISKKPAFKPTKEPSPKKLGNLPFYKTFNESMHYAEHDLSKNKSDQILSQFNSTNKKFSANKPLNKLFEEVAQRNQDHPAIVFEEQFLSFGELNYQANQLAHYLVTRGISEGECIGVMLPKSLDMVVAILAVLKAGGTYIPLSPNETNRRLQYIVHNASIQAVITLSDISKDFSILDDNLVKVVQLDIEKGGMAEMETENLNLASPSTSACILYTSSPMAPVGTPFNSKTILNELNWFWQNYPYTNTEICCLSSRPYRTEFMYEFWGPLLKGIPNVFIGQKILVDPPALVEYLNDIRAQRIQLSPTMLGLMLQIYPDLSKRLPLLKTWFLRGEQIHQEILDLFLHSAVDKTVIGLYNVTESGGVTAYQDLADLGKNKGSFILGTPINNTRIFLLDEDGFQVKPGGVGQILVSSLGTESGYHNNNSFTGNFFAKDKLSSKTNSRSKLFRTGDYGRITADGKLEYLGRKDKRIKVYGRRLDLDNIAKVLRKQAQVKDAVIEASHNKLGQLSITAFLLVADQTYSIQNWRKYLLNQMPQYM